MAPVTLALDAMGGDVGPAVTVPAACRFVTQHVDCSMILIGLETDIRRYLPGGQLPPRLEIQIASQVVAMDEPPASALRKKKDSSLRVAINLVKSGRADACISCGNTGALMATARFVLKTLPHIDRPAIIASVPAVDGRTWMLDLGANIDSSAEHLRQFAIMGAELIRAVDGVSQPVVGLLNVGQEDIKGSAQIRLAHQLVSKSGLNYAGYVEGDDIYLRAGLDLVVTDGFAGNIALKTSEGVAKLIKTLLQREYRQNWLRRLAAVCSLPVLKSMQQQIDPRCYNGAALLGLRGIVVKSHGGADQFALEHALSIAKKEVRANVPDRIADRVAVQLA
ncbi:MAG: phosphate acyltransferase PlsX [Pseudomonadota bacterium]